MGKTIICDSIEDMCDLMCGNTYDESQVVDDTTLEEKWAELEDVATYEDETGCLKLQNAWWRFNADEEVTNIWHWFDVHHSKGVGWLSENI